MALLNTTDPTVDYAYASVQDEEAVELLLFPVYSYCSKRHLFTDGRPRALADIPISVYGALIASIQPCQANIRRYGLKRVLCLILPLTIAPFIFVFVEEWVEQNHKDQLDSVVADFYMAFTYIYLIIVYIVLFFRTRAYIHNTFHPAVQEVIEEMQPQVEQAGFSVELVLEKSCVPQCFLRFTPLGKASPNGAATKDAKEEPLI